MFKLHRLIFVTLAIVILISPYLAEARAGGGRSSMGSRGSRTYSAPSYSSKAQPIQRSATTAQTRQPAVQSGLNGQQPMQGAAMNAGGGSFWRGMAGGFVGAGIASMIFGHSPSHAAGAGGVGSGAGSMFGSLMQVLLIGGLIYFAVRMFKGRAAGSYSSPMGSFSNNFASNNNSYAEQAVDTSTSLLITDSDKEAFGQLLSKIQHNWSEGDLSRLRQFVTPEMLQYFSEELSANASRGLANKVEQVTLERAEIAESWSEYDLGYATASLEWSAVDYMVHLDKNKGEAGYIASGSDTKTENVSEVWTFARASGGNWLLAAIQQVK